MRLSRRIAVAGVSVSLLVAAAACGNSGDSGTGGTAVKDVEVFTWWADGGEKAGLDGLVAQFGKDCAGQEFVNGAVAGGAGANAKQVLASRLAQNDPPDTFQAHAGAELKDYIKGELDKKADSKTVDQLAQSMTLLADSHRKLMEGELNRAQRAAVQEQIDETLDARQEKGWSRKERRLATFAGAFGVMGVISSMTYTFHALGVI